MLYRAKGSGKVLMVGACLALAPLDVAADLGAAALYAAVEDLVAEKTGEEVVAKDAEVAAEEKPADVPAETAQEEEATSSTEAAAKTGLFGEVVVATKDNFDELISSNPDGILMEFYAPWCGHCKKLEPEYEAAAKKLAELDIKVPLAKIDANEEEHRAIAEQHEIKGFPTLKWFVGGTSSEYDGGRDADAIVEWIQTMTGPAVVDGEPKDDDLISVTWYGADKELFEQVAKANRKEASWYFVQQDSEAGKMVVRHRGEEAIEAAPTSREELEAAWKAASLPTFGALDGHTFGAYAEKQLPVVWTLLPMSKDNAKEVAAEAREAMTEVGKKLAGRVLVTWTDTAEFGHVIENMFGLKEFPQIVVQPAIGEKKHFIMASAADEEKKLASADDITAYVESVLKGEVEPNLRSEAAPEEPQEEPVKVIVGKTLREKVFSADRDVLLEIYAPWCGHCQKLEPEYNKLGRKIAKDGFEDILTIAKMDGTLNDSPVDAVDWTGFPTMLYVKAGSEEVTKYEGARDAKSIWKWIKKNHSKADLIEEKIAEKAAKKKEAVKDTTTEEPKAEEAKTEEPAATEEEKPAREDL
ncbi:unnamed protein product [Amoebophrya sp. A25]|nr:unnamed protein product [Amoebophrya sp. A25]|eukprot:GSA25T00023590001.1